MGFVIFISLAQAIIFAGHIFLYSSFVHFFKVTDWPILLFLKLGLLALSFSFLSSSLLVHWLDNPITRALYYVSSIWLGLLFYIFLGFYLIWTMLLFARIFSFGVNTAFLATAMIVMASSFTAYGVINAANPVLHYIDVRISNLPDGWKGRKAVQISDVHLGAINRQGFLKRVVDTANSVDPDIVFITGDLFDGIGDDPSHLCEPLRFLVNRQGVYFISGNHETYLGIEKAAAAVSNLHITVLRDSLIEIDGVQILGIDYPMPGERRNFDAILGKIDRARPSILLFHSPVNIAGFKESGVSLQLSGHTHRGQLWPLNYVTRMIYRGFDYGISADGAFAIYTTCGTGTWGPPMRIGNRPEIVVINFL